MRRTLILGASLLACLLMGAIGRGQSSLDELERRLDKLPDPAALPREPGYLGLVADDKLPGGGVRVTGVYPGSPAATAGIEPGDLILALGGVEVRSLDEMGKVLAAYNAGSMFDIELRRGVRKTKARVTLGRRPDSSPAPRVAEARPSLGVKVVPLTEEARTRYGLAVATGALVASVDADSPASAAGLMQGAAIVAIDGRRVDTPDQLAASVAALRVGQEVEVAYYVGDLLYRKPARLAAMVDVAAAAPEPRAAARPPAASAVEELAELRRTAAGLQSQLDELQRRINTLEARISAEEKK